MKGITRRLALKLLAGAALAWSVPARAWAFFIKALPVRTVEIEDFAFDPATGLVRRGGAATPYELVIDGLVARPARLNYAQLAAMPQTRQTVDFHCVEGWSVADLDWSGPTPAALAALVEPRPEARYVVFHALGNTRSRPGGLDHYVECLPLADLLNPDLACLLALTLGGQPLPLEHGAPLRLIAPFDLAYKSIKFVTRLEFAADPVDGWWTRANDIYERVAPVPGNRLRGKNPRA
jgi:DMSO/TMAO reductase YedYZ molybdopterin-dependent catalytic subunit